jgi:Sortase domain
VWVTGWGRAATACVALLVALAGAGLVWLALVGFGVPARPPDHDSASPGVAVDRASPAPRKVARTPDAGRRGTADLISGPVLPDSKPVRLTIPRLRVSSGLVDLGVDSRGAMEVPGDPAVAGWYDLGPTPGALGPAVIAGHVTWNRVPAVFFQLASLRPGDLVRVSRADHRDAVFTVRRVERFDKSHFPTRAVFGPIDHAGLRLITCGGAYDGAAHRYLDNIVVFASLVAER